VGPLKGWDTGDADLALDGVDAIGGVLSGLVILEHRLREQDDVPPLVLLAPHHRRRPAPALQGVARLGLVDLSFPPAEVGTLQRQWRRPPSRAVRGALTKTSRDPITIVTQEPITASLTW
jgi:hypothetical protein